MLTFSNVSFSYSAQQQPALREVSFGLEPGRRIAVLGANGSGKSTLARLANGLFLPTQGSITLVNNRVCLDEDISSFSASKELRRYVALVMQDPDLQLVATSVADEVAFGPRNLGLSLEVINQRVVAALAAVGLSGFELRDPNSLSGGEKQRLVVAGALAMAPRYLVLDEPTAMLDAEARTEVLAAVRAQQQAGCGILYITHHLHEALEADTVLVLDAGQVVFSGTPEQLLKTDERGHGHQSLSGLMVPPALYEELKRPNSRSLADGFDAGPQGGARESDKATTLSLYFDKVDFSYRLSETNSAESAMQARTAVFSDFTCAVAQGSVTLLSGSSGSGKSTLLKLACGLLLPDSGAIRVAAKVATNVAAQPSIAAQPSRASETLAPSDARTDDEAPKWQNPEPGLVGLAFQNPESQFFAATVLEDIAFGPRTLGLVNSTQTAEHLAVEALSQTGLSLAEFAGRSPFTLSGGEARRVAIAATLALQPQVLLLDEPTAGLDAGGCEQILRLIRRLADAGTTVLVASHDLSLFESWVDAVIWLPKPELLKPELPKPGLYDPDLSKRRG